MWCIWIPKKIREWKQQKRRKGGLISRNWIIDVASMLKRDVEEEGLGIGRHGYWDRLDSQGGNKGHQHNTYTPCKLFITLKKYFNSGVF